jgi:hypothetical protein
VGPCRLSDSSGIFLTRDIRYMSSPCHRSAKNAGTATFATLAMLPTDHRERLGTRKATRALGPFNQGVSALRRRW